MRVHLFVLHVRPARLVIIGMPRKIRCVIAREVYCVGQHGLPSCRACGSYSIIIGLQAALLKMATANLDGLPLKRSLFMVLVVAVGGSSSIGYALGYSSSALIDLEELPNSHAFSQASIESQLFVVSTDILNVTCMDLRSRELGVYSVQKSIDEMNYYYNIVYTFQSLLAVGAVPGCVLGAWWSDRNGRRAAILATSILTVIGWLLIFIAQYTETPSTFKAFILLGRLWVGVTSGAFGSVIPVSVIRPI